MRNKKSQNCAFCRSVGEAGIDKTTSKVNLATPVINEFNV